MKFFSISKDGGPESCVSAFWLCEIKSLFSIVLLRFGDGSREAFRSHAFNSVGWVLKGKIQEQFVFPPSSNADAVPGTYVRYHRPGFRPIVVKRSTLHRVFSFGTTWVLNIRGPWAKNWQEYSPATGTWTIFSNGRKVEKTWK
jgi:hypothetical protein